MEENTSMSNINKSNKSVFGYRKTAIGQENVGDEFSWPPRSYTCSFCKKEFRSAQALGGHMNVHRREKAKLRQVTPIRFLYPQSQHFSSSSKFLDLNLNLHLNPNPNPTISTSFASSTSSLPTMLSPFTYWASFSTFRSRKSDIVLDGFDVRKESMNVKESVAGSLVESKFDGLDLELRLGCS